MWNHGGEARGFQDLELLDLNLTFFGGFGKVGLSFVSAEAEEILNFLSGQPLFRRRADGLFGGRQGGEPVRNF